MKNFYWTDIPRRLRIRFTYCSRYGHMIDPRLGRYCYNCGKSFPR